MILVFSQITYYFTLRFTQLNKKLKFLTKHCHDNINNQLKEALDDINFLFNQINEYNQFWKYYLFIEYGVFLFLVGLGTYMAFFGFLSLMFRLLVILSMMAVLSVLTVLSVSAASVVKRGRQSYQTLHSLTFKKMPLYLRERLLVTLERMAGPEQFIGFTCLDLFTVTYATYFKVRQAKLKKYFYRKCKFF